MPPVPPPVTSSSARPRVRRTTRPGWQLAAWGVALVLLGGAGWVAWHTWGPGAAPDAAWTATPATRGDLEDTVTATGTLQPKEFVDVGTQVSGQVRSLKVELGAQVTEGQLLAEIDPSVYQSRVDADRAQLRNQRAQLADRQAQAALARLQLTRQRNLARDDATTTEQVQTAEAALQSANAQVESLRAQIEQTESTLRGDEANLGYTKIRAPMSGTVVSVTAKQGQTLNANQSAPIVLRIADLSTMTVQSQVSEADVGQLRLGMPVYFTTLSGDQRRFYGTLRQVSPTPTVVNNVVLYDALFDVPNPDQVLMTQMTAQVFFVSSSARNAVLVPVAALRPVPRADRPPGGERAASQARAAEPGASATAAPRPARAASGSGRGAAQAGVDARGQFANRPARLSVLGADGQAVEREVRVGVVNRVSAQILSGVEVGEPVIIGRKPAAGAASARPTGSGLTPNVPGGGRGGPR